MIYFGYYGLSNFSVDLYIIVIMKKYILTFLIILTFVLSGCEEEQQRVSYDFENFHWYFPSENYYYDTNVQLSWLWYQLLQNDIISIYTQQEASWFTNSIIISKKITDQKLDDFVRENIDLIKNSWFKEESEKRSSFSCRGNTLNVITRNSKVKTNLETIYLSQSFFRQNDYIYIVSFATLDIDERNNFTNNIKNTSCE